MTQSKPDNYPSASFISDEYYITGVVHERIAIGRGPDWYITYKADGSDPDTIYLFKSNNSTPTKVAKGQTVKLQNSEDTITNNGDSYLITSGKSGDENFQDMAVVNGKLQILGDQKFSSISDFDSEMATMTVSYKDIDTGEDIATPTVTKAMSGTKYTVGSAPEIDGYTFTKQEGNSTGTYTVFNSTNVGRQWVELLQPYNSNSLKAVYTYKGKNSDGIDVFHVDLYADDNLEASVDISTESSVKVETSKDGTV